MQKSGKIGEICDKARRGNLLLLGPKGSGRTYVLDALLPYFPHSILLPRVKPPKTFLQKLLEELHARGDYRAGEPWPKLARELSRTPSRDMALLIMETLGKSERYTLLLDDVDEATPVLAEILQRMLKYCHIVATAKERKESIAYLFDAFQTYELKPLSKEEIEGIIEERTKDIFVEDKELLKKKLVKKARGNPGMVSALLGKMEGNMDLRTIEEEFEEAPQRKILDLTFTVFILAGVVMAIRYIGLGTSDKSLYILAGVGYAFFIVARYFSSKMSYRGEKKS